MHSYITTLTHKLISSSLLATNDSSIGATSFSPPFLITYLELIRGSTPSDFTLPGSKKPNGCTFKQPYLISLSFIYHPLEQNAVSGMELTLSR